MNPIIGGIAATRGEQPAVVDERGTTTWAQLDERSTRLAVALGERGLAAGDRVVAVLGNQAELVELSLACCVGGFVLVPLNWHWVAPEIAYVLDDAGAAAVVADERFVDVVDAAVAASDDHAVPRILVGSRELDGWAAYEVLIAAASCVLDEPTKGGPMFYTSGTTGHPKGVRSALTSVGGSPDLFVLMAHSMGPTLGVAPSGPDVEAPPCVQLICGPMYHSAQWVFAMFTLLCGARLVLQHRFDAAELLDLVDDHGITNLHLVPTQMSRILALPDERRAACSGATLRSVLHGAAPCPPAVKRSLIDWWGPIVTEYYGGTEGGFISVISAAEWLERPTSVGKPVPLIEVGIHDADGTPLPAGETGEIWFRHLLGSDFEYHNAPEKTSSAHRHDGSGTLGDVGYLDGDGYLHLADRKIDMIVSGGVNIYPAEVEGALAGHRAVADAAVFGIPDDEMGEQVMAVVVPIEARSEDEELTAELEAHVRSQLAGYKCPRRWELAAELPRTEAGKLLKRELREPYWSGVDRAI